MKWGFLIYTICLGCGASSPSPESLNNRLDPHNLYPMEKGNAWSYEIDTGDGEKALAIHRVVLQENDQVQVLAGNTIHHYRISAEGIYRTGNSVWLLKAPIEVGAHWPSSSGMEAQVSSVNSEVDTLAGKFKNCVEIQESGGEVQRRIITVYCPSIGPVYVESSLNVKGKDIQVVGRLKGYQVQ